MQEIKQIVRIINADIPGSKSMDIALTSITGIGHSFSQAVCSALKMDQHRKIGSLSKEEVKKVEEVIKSPESYKIPSYLFNRENDPETGKNKHIINPDLKLTHEFDIKNLKTIKSYRGIRHAQGLPLRGQRTRSNFRKGKTVGVSKKKAKAAQKQAKKSK